MSKIFFISDRLFPSCCFCNIHSLCGYSNHLQWDGFQEEDIDAVEKYVRTELLLFITEKCEGSGNKIDSNTMCFFFGVFEFDVIKFRFLPGERRLLKQITKYVNQVKVEKKSWFKSDESHKISTKDTFRMPFGIFFGQKPKHSKPDDLKVEPGNMKTKLFNKIQSMFDLLKIKTEMARPFDENVLDVKNMGNCIQANII